MAEWFHRNPLKATSYVTFELRGIATNGTAQQICSNLRQTRDQLMELLLNPANQTALVSSTLNTYLGLLYGFVISLEEGGRDSILRHALTFKWTNTLLGYSEKIIQGDALYEEICILFNVALWFSKHAAAVAGKVESPNMEEALEVHKCLRIAAGLFAHIKRDLLGRLKERPNQKATDLDPNIIEAYFRQCLAEAQEVTIARAIELKHNAAIISSLAHETGKLYKLADDALNSVGDRVCLKWQKYLQFKSELYYAYAYSYHGESLLAQDKCGEAIKCLKESKSYYAKAVQLIKEYSSANGAGKTAKPEEHPFFRRLGPILSRTLEKCEYENGLIFHQKVPPATPELPQTASYGVATPEEFQVPLCHPSWTVDAYKAFDGRRLLQMQNDLDAVSRGQGEFEVAPVKEKEIPKYANKRDTVNDCIIS